MLRSRALPFLLLALLTACSSAEPDIRDGGVDGADASSSGPDASQLGRDAGADAGADAGSGPAKVTVHYDVGFGHKITLRGSAAPLDWNAGVDTTWTAGNAWVASLDVTGEVELKPLVDDTKWAEGPNWKVHPGESLEVWPYFDHKFGKVTKWMDWTNSSLGNTRPVWVYTPPSYDENAAEKYPVVYMHDGQNLFYDSDAFGGVSWNVQGAMDQGIADGSVHEALIVGIGNTNARIDEYTPVADPKYGGGKGDVYLTAVISDLKPKVDSTYRTLPDAAHTAMAGSSLGGLISAHAGNKYPSTFGLLGVVSPSTWWNGTWIIGQVAGMKTAAVKPVGVYVDSGDSGDSNDDVANTAKLAQTYTDAGIEHFYWVQQGAVHNESFWRQRVGVAFKYLLGPGR